jgi:CO/xanthine dehydrogenase Mo-binding subunit
MNTTQSELEFTEPERYELREGPFYHFEMDRREFVQILGAGILISVAVSPALAQRSRNARPVGVAERLHVGADGVITVLTGKVEVGQGSRTEITQAAAEELRVPVDRVRLIMADSEVVPDDGGTAGSRTTPSTIPAVRKGCAAARQLLLDTAAQNFQVEAQTLSVRDGQVQGLGAGRAFGYPDLAGDKLQGALKREAAPGITLTEVAQWRVLGRPVPRVNGPEIVMGAHAYPSDVLRPGMLYGKALRPPSYGADLIEIDLAPARALPGVTAVQDGDFVGFAAPTSLAAEQAREAAAKTASWKTASQPSSDDLYDSLRAHARSGRSGGNSNGSVEEALKNAAKVLRETYHVAYIQHAPMEPRAAVAEWKDGHLTVWTGTQQPSRVHQDLVRAFRIPREQVRLIVPDTGGGFGGKHSGEVALEAARLAKAAQKPVSVRWSREDEFTWAYFRPAGVIDVAGGLDGKGVLVGWEQVNFNSGASALATPYEIPNASTDFKNCEAPLRSGSYRGLAATANNFARESFMDELANAAGVDPFEFRLRHLKMERLRAVLTAAADKFGWKEEWKTHATPQTTGVGLACGTEKGSYVATCAKIGLDERDGTFRVLKVCEAFECGAVLNPANLKAQIEGCIIQGLGAALREEIRFKDGKILNPRFSQYHVPRFKDVPEIEPILVNRSDLPSVGAGETPIIGIAPAVANALFNAVQTRIRSLPIRNEKYRATG